MFISTWGLVMVVLGLIGLLGLIGALETIVSARKVWDPEGRLKEPTLTRLLLLHRGRAKFGSTSPTKRMSASVALADRIGLGKALWQFYQDIRHFPQWYANGRLPDGAKWRSSVVPAAAVTSIAPKDLPSLGIPIPNDSPSAGLIYRFSDGDAEYAYCAFSLATTIWDEDEKDRCRAYVVELRKRVVLDVTTSCSCDEYDNTHFSHASVDR